MKCPGQDTRFWKPGDIFEIACSQCGHPVEFFKDDPVRRCSRCGRRIQNPKLSLGCAQWCEHARECLGFDPKAIPAEDPGEASLADRLIAAMKKEFGDDQKRITHALLVLESAQELLREEGGDPRVIMAAAVLHDIGIPKSRKKQGRSAGRYRKIEGPPAARRIMEELNLDQDTIEQVSRVIGNHHDPEDTDTPESRIVWDADWLVNIPEEFPDAGSDEISRKIGKIFKTSAGKKKAYEIYGGDKA